MFKKLKKINKNLLIYFICAFIPRIITIVYMWPIKTPVDEVSMMALPAYLAGYDWSYAVGKTGYYYGYGLSILYYPLYCIFRNPIILYRSILGFNALIQTIPGFIAFYISDNFFKIRDAKLKIILSLIASYCVCVTATNIMNEHMLYVIAWMIMVCLLKLVICQDYKEKVLFSVILMLSLSYALTCHERAMVFVAAIFVVIIFYAFFEKKILVSIIPSLLSLSVGYKIYYLVTNKVRTIIWGYQENISSTNNNLVNQNNVSNTSVEVDFSMIFKEYYWDTGVDIILGQVSTGTMVTGGFLITAFVVFIWILIEKILNFNRENINIFNKYFLYSYLFGFACVIATIVAHSITWVWPAMHAIEDSSKSEGGRAFTYLRYYFPCVGFLIYLTLIYLYINKGKRTNRIMESSLVLILFSQLYFIYEIVPLIERTPLLNYIHNSYWIFSYQSTGEFTNCFTFIPACVMCILFSAIVGIMIKKNKYKISYILLLCLLLFQYISLSIQIDIWKSSVNYANVKETWEVIEMMEKDDVLPEYIGVGAIKIDETKTPIVLIYQFLFQDKKIYYRDNTILHKEAIVLDNRIEIPEIIINEQDNWYVINIADKQKIYFKGERIREYFEGINMEIIVIKKSDGLDVG